MKRICLLILAFCLCNSAHVMAIGHQMKVDPWQHTQPNGTTTFDAVRWGHYLKWQYETDDGYTIIQSIDDGYWYYAELDSTGEYTPSEDQVGIDEPQEGPHLRRSEGRQRTRILVEDEGLHLIKSK